MGWAEAFISAEPAQRDSQELANAAQEGVDRPALHRNKLRLVEACNLKARYRG